MKIQDQRYQDHRYLGNIDRNYYRKQTASKPSKSLIHSVKARGLFPIHTVVQHRIHYGILGTLRYELSSMIPPYKCVGRALQ